MTKDNESNDTISQVTSADGVIDNLKKEAASLAHEVDIAVDQAATSMGSKMSDAASSLRTGAVAASERLDQTGHYLRQSSGADFVNDIQGLMRRHPAATVGVGIGLGFLLARSLR